MILASHNLTNPNDSQDLYTHESHNVTGCHHKLIEERKESVMFPNVCCVSLARYLLFVFCHVPGSCIVGLVLGDVCIWVWQGSNAEFFQPMPVFVYLGQGTSAESFPPTPVFVYLGVKELVLSLSNQRKCSYLLTVPCSM